MSENMDLKLRKKLEKDPLWTPIIEKIDKGEIVLDENIEKVEKVVEKEVEKVMEIENQLEKAWSIFEKLEKHEKIDFLLRMGFSKASIYRKLQQ